MADEKKPLKAAQSQKFVIFAKRRSKEVGGYFREIAETEPSELCDDEESGEWS